MNDDYAGEPIEDIGHFMEQSFFDPYDYDDIESEFSSSINIQYVADESGTLYDAADRLEDYAADLRSLSDEGWELVSNVENGVGLIEKYSDENEEQIVE